MKQEFARLRRELRSGEAVTVSLGRLARTARRCAIVYMLIAAAAPSVEAQILASSFDQLSVLVKRGDSVIVTDDTGGQTKGTIAALSPSSLELIVAGNRRSFVEGETRTIRQRTADSLKNGTLWGVGIGAGLGLTTLIDTEDSPALPAGEAMGATLALAGLGAIVGAAVDAIVSSNEVIYSRPARTSATLKLSPTLTRGRSGVHRCHSDSDRSRLTTKWSRQSV